MKLSAVFCLALVLSPITLDAQLSDQAELLRIHASVMAAHREGLVERWMEVESEEYVSVNGGRVTFPTPDERRQAREPYLASTTFTMYRDLRTPVVRISADGSLGWLIAEVEVRGVQRGQGGEETPIRAIWAWVELYEKSSDGWRIVGNASNPRIDDEER